MGLEWLAEHATTEVEAGGLRFRLRRISATEMAQARRPALLILSAEELAGQPDERPSPASPEEARARLLEQIAESQRKAKRLGDEDARRLREADAAVVCAMVTAIYLDGAWVPVTLTLDGEPDPAAGRMPLWCLPPGCEETLQLLCYGYQTGGQHGITVLREFLQGSVAAPSGGPDRAPVRGASVDHPAGP